MLKIKKILLHTMCVLLFAMVFFISAQVVYADVLFESRRTEVVHENVIYDHIRQMTTRGMLDVHVLLVPLNDPYIYIAPVASRRAPGLRETTTNLLASAGAIAGINADFFGLAGSHSVHFGPMAAEGELLGISTYTNHSRNEFAAFFLDFDNNVFFDYIHADVRFYNNGASNVTIASINNVGHEFRFPVIIDRQLLTNTSQLVDRFSGLVKIVVEYDYIVQVTRQIVDVPENGYVLVLPAHMNDTHRHRFNVGDSAELIVGNNLNIDFSNIQAAIGGGGTILSRGRVVEGRGVAPNARHPRSAIGVTRDGNQLILMVVDGRSHSIGATHREMANFLRRFDAWEAIHFDGGGSSTMAYRQVNGRYVVANTPSDGAQRRVVNVLGIFDSRGFQYDPNAQILPRHQVVTRDRQRSSGGFHGAPGDRFSFAMPYVCECEYEYECYYEFEYSFTREGPFSITRMTLAGGRLGTYQWGRFFNDIRSSSRRHVVIILDDNPLTAFRHDAEFELFHSAMENLRDRGRTIYVVSATGEARSIEIRDGIRYINLAETRPSIRFRTYGDEIWWSD